MKYYLVIILSCFVQFCFSQINPNKVVVEKITYDSLLISNNHKKVYVKAVVDRLKYQEGSGCINCDPDDISLSVYDECNQLIYLKNYPAPNDSWNFMVTPSSLHLEGVGDVLIVNEYSLPSLGWDGDVTVYGFNDYGYLLPFTYPISLTKKFSDGTYLRIKEVDEQQKHWNIKYDCSDCKLAIETTNHSGWCGFQFLKYYPLNLDGIGSPADIKEFQPQEIPLDVTPSSHKIIDKFEDYLDSKDLTLYVQPDTSSLSKLVHLQIGTDVEFFYMINNTNGNFIYARIDGSSGYIEYWRDSEALDKLGFPECD